MLLSQATVHANDFLGKAVFEELCTKSQADTLSVATATQANFVILRLDTSFCAKPIAIGFAYKFGVVRKIAKLSE
jgi:hypothetical protein